MSVQLGLHTFVLKWVEVEPGIFLPDLADLLIQRLTDTKPLRVDHDLSAIGRNAVRQIDEVRGKRYLRLSSAGACVKQLSYVAHGVDPVVLDDWDPGAIDAGSRLTFTIGDVTESVLNAALCEVVAETAMLEVEGTGDKQVEVSLDVHGTTITGHPDGFMRVPMMVDGVGVEKYIRAVWEVKSMGIGCSARRDWARNRTTTGKSSRIWAPSPRLRRWKTARLWTGRTSLGTARPQRRGTPRPYRTGRGASSHPFMGSV